MLNSSPSNSARPPHFGFIQAIAQKQDGGEKGEEIGATAKVRECEDGGALKLLPPAD